MIGEVKSRLLRHLIAATAVFVRTTFRASRATHLQRSNGVVLEFADVLEGRWSIDMEVNLRYLDSLAEFLIGEFAQCYETPVTLVAPSALEGKLQLWAADVGIHMPWVHSYDVALGEHARVCTAIMSRPLDVLFVAALPLEYRAIVRRFDYYFGGTNCKATRGYGGDGAASPGWVVGAIADSGQVVKVGAVCCAGIGPIDSASATALMLDFRARHVVVVGICASLDDNENLSMGDVGISHRIEDVSVGKNETDTSIETAIDFPSADEWAHIAHKAGGKTIAGLSWENAILTLRGVLSGRAVAELQACCSSPNSRAAIATLSERARRAESTNLLANARTHDCPAELLTAAQRVAAAGTWKQGIQAERPVRDGKHPHVVSTGVLSGSSVVKAHGMRERLQESFPGCLMLEMEGGGAARICEQNQRPAPIVIKAVSDWADPDKHKIWQPYCADVAAAFARSLACALLASEQSRSAR